MLKWVALIMAWSERTRYVAEDGVHCKRGRLLTTETSKTQVKRSWCLNGTSQLSFRHFNKQRWRQNETDRFDGSLNGQAATRTTRCDVTQVRSLWDCMGVLLSHERSMGRPLWKDGNLRPNRVTSRTHKTMLALKPRTINSPSGY